MTNEEAEQLITKATKQLKRGTFEGSRIAGVGAICLLPFVLTPYAGVFFAVGSGSLAVTSVACYFIEINDRHRMRKIGTWDTWNALTTPEFPAPPLPNATFLLKNSIAVLYQQDVNAQTFPLVQAMRLLDAHTRQQRRLEVVEYRLVQLQVIYKTMRDKLKQLRALGEDAPEVERKLAQLKGDIAALENIAAQISASCARLEAIFTGVQHAHQVRQLKRELGELSQVAGSSSDSDLALDSDAFDIERQIGREIETFIRLERETDEHLRDV